MSIHRTYPPESDSIFGNTLAGVPNPNVPHVHPYPTRHHGPRYGWVDYNSPYRENPWVVQSGVSGVGTVGNSCDYTSECGSNELCISETTGAQLTEATQSMLYGIGTESGKCVATGYNPAESTVSSTYSSVQRQACESAGCVWTGEECQCNYGTRATTPSGPAPSYPAPAKTTTAAIPVSEGSWLSKNWYLVGGIAAVVAAGAWYYHKTSHRR